MGIFFTGDNHFCHGNVIEYTGRQYNGVEEMNEDMTRRWNGRVSPQDTVYHVGDFGFARPDTLAEILDHLNGKKIFIFGNHDRKLRKSPILLDRFESTHELLEINIPDPDAARGLQSITLCHYPMLSWNKIHYGAWHLHGHCHGNMAYPMEARIHDVGVDNNNFTPVSYEEIKEIMATKTYVPLDHHETRT